MQIEILDNATTVVLNTDNATSAADSAAAAVAQSERLVALANSVAALANAGGLNTIGSIPVLSLGLTGPPPLNVVTDALNATSNSTNSTNSALAVFTPIVFSISRSPSMTSSPTQSSTPSATTTASQTPSSTSTPTQFNTGTHSQTSSQGASPSQSGSPTPTASQTGTASLSGTRTQTQSRTASMTKSITSTSSGTASLTSTPSVSPTQSASVLLLAQNSAQPLTQSTAFLAGISVAVVLCMLLMLAVLCLCIRLQKAEAALRKKRPTSVVAADGKHDVLPPTHVTIGPFYSRYTPGTIAAEDSGAAAALQGLSDLVAWDAFPYSTLFLAIHTLATVADDVCAVTAVASVEEPRGPALGDAPTPAALPRRRSSAVMPQAPPIVALGSYHTNVMPGEQPVPPRRASADILRSAALPAPAVAHPFGGQPAVDDDDEDGAAVVVGDSLDGLLVVAPPSQQQQRRASGDSRTGPGVARRVSSFSPPVAGAAAAAATTAPVDGDNATLPRRTSLSAFAAALVAEQDSRTLQSTKSGVWSQPQPPNADAALQPRRSSLSAVAERLARDQNGSVPEQPQGRRSSVDGGPGIARRVSSFSPQASMPPQQPLLAGVPSFRVGVNEGSPALPRRTSFNVAAALIAEQTASQAPPGAGQGAAAPMRRVSSFSPHAAVHPSVLQQRRSSADGISGDMRRVSSFSPQAGPSTQHSTLQPWRPGQDGQPGGVRRVASFSPQVAVPSPLAAPASSGRISSPPESAAGGAIPTLPRRTSFPTAAAALFSDQARPLGSATRSGTWQASQPPQEPRVAWQGEGGAVPGSSHAPDTRQLAGAPRSSLTMRRSSQPLPLPSVGEEEDSLDAPAGLIPPRRSAGLPPAIAGRRSSM